MRDRLLLPLSSLIPTCTHMHIRTLSLAHKHTHTHAHMRAHTHAHTHIHTHTQEKSTMVRMRTDLEKAANKLEAERQAMERKQVCAFVVCVWKGVHLLFWCVFVSVCVRK